jgi:hypothetical protein
MRDLGPRRAIIVGMLVMLLFLSLTASFAAGYYAGYLQAWDEQPTSIVLPSDEHEAGKLAAEAGRPA